MRLGELARRLGVQRPPSSELDLELLRLAPPDHAGAGDLSFVPDKKFLKRIRGCRASAIIVERNTPCYGAAIPLVVSDSMLACSRASEWLTPLTRETLAATRRVQRYENVDPEATFGARVSMGRAVSVGAHTRVEPGCVIGDGVRIGDYCVIGANVTITAAATIGNRVRVGPGSVIGGDPFSYVRDGGRWHRLPGFGSVSIGDDVDCGSNTTIDRGTIGDTAVKRGAKLDNHVQVGHGTVIGEDVAIAARTAIAGEAMIGDGCLIGGAVGISEGVFIAAGIRISAMSMVTKSLYDTGGNYSSGWPAIRSSVWWRQVADFRRRGGRHV